MREVFLFAVRLIFAVTVVGHRRETNGMNNLVMIYKFIMKFLATVAGDN